MAKGRTIQVKESAITVISQNETDYISLTDMTVGFNEGRPLEIGASIKLTVCQSK